MLERLGAASTGIRVASLAREARLDLLPPGGLRQLETVLDVGANEGRWSAAVIALARPRSVVAVEPSPVVLASLQAAIGSLKGVSIVSAAVGDSVGVAQLNLTTHSHTASLLSPRSEAMNAAYSGGYDITRRVTVPLTTIDHIMREAESVSLIKLDVQGGERAAIAGAKATLGRTRWVLIETNFQSHYVGDMLFPELHAELTTHDFRLVGMSQPFMRLGVAMWCDSLYERVV
jgi:FkbM family methyltransferase